MFKAEKRARTTGKLVGDGVEVKNFMASDDRFTNSKDGKWINSVVPILVILIGTIAGLFYTGMLSLEASGVTDYSLQNIISHSDSFKSLLWASLGAGIIAVVMTVWQKILSLHDSMEAWQRGIQSMLFAVIILVFAWGISQVTVELKTADYIISVLSDSINPRLLPVLVFIICGGISFATGTSWGTMAIVMPIVIPLASEVSRISGLSVADTTIIIHGVISSVLAGSVWGDHCSPIADTTILSSMASQCNHIDHVRTQLPYALLVGFVSMILGDWLTAYGLNPFISILMIFAALYAILMLVGKRVGTE
jgi:Na+/H+ antiporter NhaC